MGPVSGRSPSCASFSKDEIDKHNVPAEKSKWPIRRHFSGVVSLLFSVVFIFPPVVLIPEILCCWLVAKFDDCTMILI